MVDGSSSEIKKSQGIFERDRFMVTCKKVVWNF
jgi:hypothetical protein